MSLPSFFINDTRIARKQHKCCECRGQILAGEAYHCLKGVWEGEWAAFKICPECQQLREYVLRTGVDEIQFGDLYGHVFEGRDSRWVRIFMDTRRKRNAPESPNGWMERKEQELYQAKTT